MIDHLLAHGADPAAERDLLRHVIDHAAAVRASARQSDSGLVAAAEAAVIADPRAFTFDAAGSATLTAAGQTWHAGRFDTIAIGALRQRVAAARQASTAPAAPASRPATIRFWVLDGASPATDIGSLQATAGEGALFQVASQYNCLEAPGPAIVPVKRYLSEDRKSVV